MKTYATNLGNLYSSEVKEKNIVVIAISQALEQLAIATSDNARKVLTDEVCTNIIYERIVPSFEKGSYFDGIKSGIDELIVEWNEK